MSVPEYWWNGCKENTIYMGKIAGIKDGTKGGKNFIFELDRTKEDNRSLPPEQYSMRYDAVLHYANHKHDDFSDFTVPDVPPAAPSPNNSMQVGCSRRSTRIPLSIKAATCVLHVTCESIHLEERQGP